MIEIIATADGSHTLKHIGLDENYHSDRGAYTESMHVFVQEGMLAYNQSNPEVQLLRILEVGFGTGLNAILTWQVAQEKGFSVNYDSLEPYPVDLRLIEQTNYTGLLDTEASKQTFHSMHQSAWNEPVAFGHLFQLTKYQVKLADFTPVNGLYDVVYFDAFAPNKQPELWSLEALKICYDALKIGGVLTTYCAQGQFKRDLRSLGFDTERVAGPPNGKREMTRAWKKPY